MAKFTKDVLYPDSYHLPDGRVIDISKQESKGLGKRMEEMLSAGLQIPIAFEHQPDAVPTTSEERARQAGTATKLIIGHAEKSFTDPAGVINADVDVPVAGDADRVRAVKYVSPGIRYDFKDGTGKVWPGPSIVHLAVTGRPVQHKQKPFQPISMSMAKLGKGKTFCLSLEDDETESKGEGDKEEKKGEEEKPKGTAVDLKELLELLKSKEINLPDDTDGDNFIERLRVALVAVKPPELEEPQTQVVPIAMSQNTQLTAVEKRLIQMGKSDLERRLTALHTSGRINKPIHDKLEGELKTVNLSLTADGSFAASSVESKISAYEDLPAGNAFNLSDGATPVDPPGYAGNGGESPNAVEKTIDQFFELAGTKKK